MCRLYVVSLNTNVFVAAKCDSDDVRFRKFKKKIFHEALGQMLQSLKSGMEKAEVVRCPDGHHRRAIYGIGPYIADYPEQVLLACIVQNWCGRWVDSNWIDLYILMVYLDVQPFQTIWMRVVHLALVTLLTH